MIWFAVINPVLSPASPQARALSDLFVVTLVVCAVIFLIVTGVDRVVRGALSQARPSRRASSSGGGQHEKRIDPGNALAKPEVRRANLHHSTSLW